MRLGRAHAVDRGIQRLRRGSRCRRGSCSPCSRSIHKFCAIRNIQESSPRVPGVNRSRLRNARSTVSCTRSSASADRSGQGERKAPQARQQRHHLTLGVDPWKLSIRHHDNGPAAGILPGRREKSPQTVKKWKNFHLGDVIAGLPASLSEGLLCHWPRPEPGHSRWAALVLAALMVFPLPADAQGLGGSGWPARGRRPSRCPPAARR